MELNIKLIQRLLIELGISILILIGFAYDLTGSFWHEIFGISMVVLIILHHVFNYRWYLTLHKGKYNKGRSFRTCINIGLAVSSLLMILSGLLNSYVLEELLGITWTWDTRSIHTVSAYWYLVFASAHLGMHWSMIKTMVRNSVGLKPKRQKPAEVNSVWNLIIAVCLTAFGGYAIYSRQVVSKLFGQMTYDFWDFDTTIWPFFTQCCGVMFFFAYLLGILYPKWFINRKPKSNPKVAQKAESRMD